MKKTWIYTVNIAAALGVGVLSAFVSGNMDVFQTIEKPPLTPPAALFPIVWTILFTLMGIGISLVLTSDSKTGQKKESLRLYVLQLIFNFFWSILFFNMRLFGVAFFWLLALWILIVLMTVSFRKSSKPAAYLQIPYIVWVAFAGYLNLAIYFLSK
ncbi:MAG: tryptophan-rich sensory protein [Clostridia bacterium]|nr:tryptophan-rich sensory protein [Clostridia bacterium]